MKKLFFTLIIALVASALKPTAIMASDPEADAAATLVAHAPKTDERIVLLRDFLSTHNSPMVGVAGHFVSEADRLEMDWKLVAAIAGVESTFGKHIPTNSYNAWGWGVFTGTNDGVHFKNWADGITQVSEGLRYNYMDKGATTIESVGRIYAASPRWANSVRFFINKIESFAPTNPDLLSVTI